MNKFAVAPMIDWTDRQCRRFHRLLTKHASLYTEMIVDQAVLHGDANRLLDANEPKQNVVLQLGGSDPKTLAQATRIAHDLGYQEINLNCGCPSDRVQAGTFGAVLMLEPKRVAEALAAMKAASAAKVSVKIRLGVDEQNPAETLPAFLEEISKSGIVEVTIHARKAWLKGLSPKENRDIPPLDYELAAEMRKVFEPMQFALNGGIENLEQAQQHLKNFDGVMLGRAAYQRPYDTLAKVDNEIYGSGEVVSRAEIIEEMTFYLEQFVAEGGRVHSVARHMLGLFHGQNGGRKWRQILSERAKYNNPRILLETLNEISVYS